MPAMQQFVRKCKKVNEQVITGKPQAVFDDKPWNAWLVICKARAFLFVRKDMQFQNLSVSKRFGR